MKRPEQVEYPHFFQNMINLVKEGDYFTLLDEYTLTTIQFYQNIDVTKLDYKYGADKWTIKEVLMHCIDTERAFAYRAFVCARGDENTVLYGMDEKLYAANIDVSTRTLESLLTEFRSVRQATKVLFENINETQSQFLGNTQRYKISARALAYINVGHFLHHEKIIIERYLN